MQPSVGADLHVDRRVFVAPVDVFQVADAVPVGRELLRLVGIEPAVVGLVVRVGGRHQFDVGPVLVSEGLAVPLVAVVHVAPGPEFAAFVDVAVSGQHRAGVLAVVVSADEVVLQVVDEHRSAHQGREVAPVADILADVVRIAAVGRIGNGPAHEAVLVVERSEFGVLREYDLVVLVGVGGDVVPVQHGVPVGAVVEEAAFHLDVGAVGIECHADGPRHAVALLDLADPDRLRSVAVVHQLVVDRILAGRAVVVEDVPFDAARDPCAEHADVGGFDHVLAVENLVSVGLVRGVEKASADVREHAHLQIVVLQKQGPVGGVDLFVGRIVVHGIGIDAAFGPLVGEVAFEKRSLFRCVHPVGGQRDGPFAHFHLAVPGAGAAAEQHRENAECEFRFFHAVRSLLNI